MGLKWDRIDFDKRTVTISEVLLYSTTRGVYSDTTKTGDIRVLALVDETIDLLLSWKEVQDYERKINGDRWQETGYIFTRDDGRPMSPDSITSWLSDFSKRHGLKHINPHAFRHSAASLMIHNGLDVLTVSGQLGHATPGTTTNIYGHMYENASRIASESIANTILRGNRKPKETDEGE